MLFPNSYYLDVRTSEDLEELRFEEYGWILLRIQGAERQCRCWNHCNTTGAGAAAAALVKLLYH